MTNSPVMTDRISAAVDEAVQAIPPVWPLASSVAVNPYLGQAGLSLAQTSALLARIDGLAATMDRSWYAKKWETGQITQDDLEAALLDSAAGQPWLTMSKLKAALSQAPNLVQPIPNVAQLVSQRTGFDWQGLIDERVGAWASGYFDAGQALWSAPQGRSAYSAWCEVATHDLTPEIAGLDGFARHVASAPHSAAVMIERAVGTLGVSQDALPTYFHSLLHSLGGWAQVARHALWKAELAGEADTTARDFLAIRLVWEEALFLHQREAVQASWNAAITAHEQPVTPNEDHIIDAVWQCAAERSAQRQLAKTLAEPSISPSNGRPVLQAAFCIDVRSEVFRRALESVDTSIQTLGFAGFFGLPTAHSSFASDVEELRLPVLLNPGVASVSGDADDQAADQSLRFANRAKRAWGRFKLAAVSSFAFVEATGPVYAAKLVRDALGLQNNQPPLDPTPRLNPTLDLESRIDAANTVLRAMSLTENFAKIVLVAGHGAHVTNNAHASALHCGACGGYSGEVNARLLAGLLNDQLVRDGLVKKGISIPGDTVFLAGLHDTTTDDVALYEDDQPLGLQRALVVQVKTWLEQAGQITRAERMLRLPQAQRPKDLMQRSVDWAQTRPEWALAGCQAFIAAPRARTHGKALSGQAFLHDYVWQKDEGFGVLELILTAPVVVASWISLQYYGSCVSPKAFGGGNKLLHNVTGGIGVVEGNGGLLRAGLPWQSVHDGDDFAHDPLRLSVCVEAPASAINDVLARHEGVRALFDNGWLNLFTLNDEGQMEARYDGDLQWKPISSPVEDTIRLAS